MRHVTLQFFDGCPNWQLAKRRLDRLADEFDIAVTPQQVRTVEQAQLLGFGGSPTILVDGSDPFATGDEPGGLTCRIYLTPEGPQGAPSIEQLRAVLASSADGGW